METRWFVDVNRYFIETKERTKKGEPVRKPVDVRKMRLYGQFIVTEAYICTLVKRHGERYVSVKMRIKPDRAWWDKTPIKDDEYKWKKEGSYPLTDGKKGFEDWLRRRIGHIAPSVICELLTAPPENLAA